MATIKYTHLPVKELFFKAVTNSYLQKRNISVIIMAHVWFMYARYMV